MIFQRFKNLAIIIFLVTMVFNCTSRKNKEIDLAGSWKFKPDSLDKGISEQWFVKDLTETILLPGSMTINGKGNPVDYDTKFTGGIWAKHDSGKTWVDDPNYKPYLREGEFLFPYWLTADNYYTGAAWYQNEIEIPAGWEDKSVELFLERCHWETQVWVNDNYIGKQNSLGTAHRYDLTGFLHSGKNKITVCVDNRVKDIQVGNDAHSITDNTQSNWNGIIGDIRLIQKDAVSIASVQIFPDVTNKSAKVKVTIKNITGAPQKGKITLQAKSTSTDSPQKISPFSIDFNTTDSLSTVEVNYSMGDEVRLWDEFNPNLYTLTVDLSAGSNQDTHQENFGMRDFKVNGTRFTVNGRPIFLRGTLECAIFPKTGFPPTDVPSWERIINVCRAHGLNHIRFHSWCPPKAAFDAADKLGFYYQVECSAWASVGDSQPIDRWLYEESSRMVEANGNHPSFCMMPYGNEPGGKNQKQYLGDFVNYWKNKDSRRVYTSGSGWPALPENDYHCLPQPRIQRWNEQLKSIINGEGPRTDYDWADRIAQYDRPVVSHEIGQWCVYPNFREIPKYDGVLKPRNFEIFKRSLEAHGMIQLADSFLMASGKLQALCYKSDIEAALRTPGFAGFQLLDLHDFPGQGTALVGVVDPFWEEKGYISPEEFSRFCNETVPLARFKKLIFTSDEKIEADLEVAHFGEKELKSIIPSWTITDTQGTEISKGKLSPVDLYWGNGIQLGKISESIAVDSAKQFHFELEVAGFVNGWDFLVYPAILPEISENILVVKSLNKEAISTLYKGGKILLSVETGSIKAGKGGEVGIGFSSIFWNTAWTNGQKPHTLGILCDPKNPALAEFPTEYHSNWQWWDAMSHSNAISLEGFSSEIKPIVRVIDDWVTNRKLALLFEAQVGNGKLLVSGIDLQSDLEKRPEARQLLFSLKKYMAGDKFAPVAKVQVEEIKDLMN